MYSINQSLKCIKEEMFNMTLMTDCGVQSTIDKLTQIPLNWFGIVLQHSEMLI